jgi:nicotinic acid phosphoribosyltransferase
MLIEPITDTHQGAALFTDLYELSMLQAYEAVVLRSNWVSSDMIMHYPLKRGYKTLNFSGLQDI